MFGVTIGECEIGCDTCVTSIFPLPVTKTFFFSLVFIMFDDIETDVCGIEFTATSIKTTEIKLNVSEKSNKVFFF